MERFYGVAGRVCACLAFALLLCSIAMVSPGGLFADDGEGPGAPIDCELCYGGADGNCKNLNPCGAENKGCSAATPGCDDCRCRGTNPNCKCKL